MLQTLIDEEEGKAKCIDEEEGKALLLEIHEGICGHHARSRALVAKSFRAGFYWPTAMKNAEEIVRRCIACQKFASKPHAPASELKTIPLSWPFATWGLDMVGPLTLLEVIGFLHKMSRDPHTSTLNLAFTEHITNALIKVREESLE